MLPLYGGGFLVAALQVSAVYYGTAILLHWLVPQIWSVKSIQVQPRQPGQVAREALFSLGTLPQRPDLPRLECVAAKHCNSQFSQGGHSQGGISGCLFHAVLLVYKKSRLPEPMLLNISDIWQGRSP